MIRPTTKIKTVEEWRKHFADLGYTQTHDFPGEYLLMINPKEVKKVRIYYLGATYGRVYGPYQ